MRSGRVYDELDALDALHYYYGVFGYAHAALTAAVHSLPSSLTAPVPAMLSIASVTTPSAPTTLSAFVSHLAAVEIL